MDKIYMNISLLLISLLFLEKIAVIFSYLTPLQKYKIEKIFKNPDTSEKTKLYIKKIIFINYLPWVNKQSNIFYDNNRALLGYVYYNSIQKKSFTFYKREELLFNAYLGFSKALNNFNGNLSTITQYSKHYIKNEIYKGIKISTKHQAYINLLKNESNNYLYNTKIKSEIKEDYQYKIKIIKDIIENSDIISDKERKIIYYRYDLNTMKRIRTIKNVSILMGFSTVTYRKYHKELMSKIKFIYTKYYEK